VHETSTQQGVISRLRDEKDALKLAFATTIRAVEAPVPGLGQRL